MRPKFSGLMIIGVKNILNDVAARPIFSNQIVCLVGVGNLLTLKPLIFCLMFHPWYNPIFNTFLLNSLSHTQQIRGKV